MDIPLVRARSWDPSDYVDRDWCTGVVPNGGMLGRNFLIGFVSMDFIGFLVLLVWLLRGGSRIYPLGLFCGLFLFLGCEIGIFLVSQILVCRFGGMSVGERYWIWFPLYGGPLT